MSEIESMEEILTYKGNLKEMDGMTAFVRRAKKRVRKDFDLVIAITGEEGMGKSVLAIQLGMRLDKNFKLEKNSIYTNEDKEIIDKITTLPRYSVLIIDEAVKLLYKLNWQSPIQKMMNQIYNLCRKENQISIFCIPRFRDLNEYFRNQRVKIWIHVIARGHAIIFTRDWSPVSKDPWYCDSLQKTIEQGSRKLNVGEIGLEEKLMFLRKSRSYATDFTFEDISDELKEEYKKLITSRYDDLLQKQSMNPNSDIAKKNRMRLGQVLDFLKQKQGMSFSEISRQTNIPWSSVRVYINKYQDDLKLKQSCL